MRVSAVAAPEQLRTAYEKTFPLASSYKVQARAPDAPRAASYICAAACAWALDCPLKVPAAGAWQRPQPLALCPSRPAQAEARSTWCCLLLAPRLDKQCEALRTRRRALRCVSPLRAMHGV